MRFVNFICAALIVSTVATSADDALAQDFVDSRLTVTFGDDDVLAQTGEQVPISPIPGFGDRKAYELFFDSLNTRFGGRETLTHLVAYKKMPGFFDHLTTEAAMVIRFDASTLALTDAGSYMRAIYNPWTDAPADGVALTLFPFDSERFRLGYLYALSFGGADFIPRRSLFRAPGLKLQFDRGPGQVFLGFKTLPARTPLEVELDSESGLTDTEVVRVDETQYMVLAGGGLDLADDRLRIDVGAGWFQQGRLDLPSYPHAAVYSFGEAVRVAWHDKLPMQSSIDFSLYRNDPDAPFKAFRPVTYTPGELGYLVSAEMVSVQQHLADSDKTNSTTFETGFAGALQAKVQYGYWRAELTGLMRDLPFILKNVPSFVPFLSIPERAILNPELFFALSTDYHFPAQHVTVGLIGGLQFPATFSTDVETGSAEASRTLVVRREGFVSILPPGVDSSPIFQSRLQVRWDLSEMLYSQTWLQYVHDSNATRLVVSEAEGTRRVFQRADQFGFGITMAARF